jgi:hypothetical protein
MISGLVSGRNQLGAAMTETFTKGDDLRPTLDLASKLCRFLFTAANVLINGGLMLQIKGDGTVNAAERERRKTILNLLGSRSLIELVDRRVERDARADQAEGAVLVLRQRRRLGQ